jgi:hypothetical protein
MYIVTAARVPDALHAQRVLSYSTWYERVPCSNVRRSYHNQPSVCNQVVFIEQEARKRSITCDSVRWRAEDVQYTHSLLVLVTDAASSHHSRLLSCCSPLCTVTDSTADQLLTVLVCRYTTNYQQHNCVAVILHRV